MKAHAVVLAARYGRGTSPAMAGIWGALEAHPDITADFHGSMAWDELVQPLAHMRAAGLGLIVIGYSLGAVRAIDLCNALAAEQAEVDLLCTIVPTRKELSWNVKRAINHTVPGGWAANWWSDDISYANPKFANRLEAHHYAGLFGASHYVIQGYPAVVRSIIAAAKKVVDTPSTI